MSAFSLDVQFNGGVEIEPPNIFTKDEHPEAFCTLTFGPKHMDRPDLTGPRVKMFFSRTEDIAELASALFRLGREFAEAIGPDAAEVVIGAKAEEPATAELNAIPQL